EYLEARHNGRQVSPKEFIRKHTLTFSKLPGMEHLSAEAYLKERTEELSVRQVEAVEQQKASGQGFPPLTAIRATKAGTRPKNTKQSHRYSFRPLVLSLCKETKDAFLSQYFTLLERYHHAVEEFRRGVLDIPFPTGTYRPPILVT